MGLCSQPLCGLPSDLCLEKTAIPMPASVPRRFSPLASQAAPVSPLLLKGDPMAASALTYALLSPPLTPGKDYSLPGSSEQSACLSSFTFLGQLRLPPQQEADALDHLLFSSEQPLGSEPGG